MSRLIIRLCLLLALGFGGHRAYVTWRPMLDDPWFRADTAWHFAQYESARTHYAQAVAVNRNHPRVPEADLRIAHCLHKLGRHQPAYLALQAFVVRHPKDEHVPEVETELEAYAAAYLPDPSPR